MDAYSRRLAPVILTMKKFWPMKYTNTIEISVPIATPARPVVLHEIEAQADVE